MKDDKSEVECYLKDSKLTIPRPKYSHAFRPPEMLRSPKIEFPLSILSCTQHDINNGTTEGPQEVTKLERGFRVFLGYQARLAGA